MPTTHLVVRIGRACKQRRCQSPLGCRMLDEGWKVLLLTAFVVGSPDPFSANPFPTPYCPRSKTGEAMQTHRPRLDDKVGHEGQEALRGDGGVRLLAALDERRRSFPPSDHTRFLASQWAGGTGSPNQSRTPLGATGYLFFFNTPRADQNLPLCVGPPCWLLDGWNNWHGSMIRQFWHPSRSGLPASHSQAAARQFRHGGPNVLPLRVPLFPFAESPDGSLMMQVLAAPNPLTVEATHPFAPSYSATPCRHRLEHRPDSTDDKIYTPEEMAVCISVI